MCNLRWTHGLSRVNGLKVVVSSGPGGSEECYYINRGSPHSEGKFVFILLRDSGLYRLFFKK